MPPAFGYNKHQTGHLPINPHLVRRAIRNPRLAGPTETPPSHDAPRPLRLFFSNAPSKPFRRLPENPISGPGCSHVTRPPDGPRHPAFGLSPSHRYVAALFLLEPIRPQTT